MMGEALMIMPLNDTSWSMSGVEVAHYVQTPQVERPHADELGILKQFLRVGASRASPALHNLPRQLASLQVEVFNDLDGVKHKLLVQVLIDGLKVLAVQVHAAECFK